MDVRAILLVLGPVRALAFLGTVSADASPLGAPAADQEARPGEVVGVRAAIGADPASKTRPVFS